MINFTGATLAAVTIVEDQAFNTDLRPINTAVLSAKGLWSVHILGVYDLIWTHVHRDYPTRLEVYTALESSFFKHHSNNYHFGKRSRPTFTKDAMPTIQIMQESMIPAGVMARVTSPLFGTTGYGLGDV